MSEATSTYETGQESGLQRLKMKLITLVSYLLPLLASIPPVIGWGGLMTIPLILFLTIMVGRLPELPASIPYLFLSRSILDVLVVVLGIITLVVAVVVLWRGKSSGLVTHSIYRVVRHPQYLGLILFTAGLTSRSVWILTHTFGWGWLNVQETILVWVAMLVVYIILASVEELHLSRTFGESWNEYRERVGFFIPTPRRLPKALEILLAFIIPILILYGLIFFSV